VHIHPAIGCYYRWAEKFASLPSLTPLLPACRFTGLILGRLTGNADYSEG
jgi:hypothetical protein